MDLLGNFWWWMASWQHGLSRGLGFCSYRPLFIPRCQSLYGNQLVNPSSPFLPLFPPSLSPQSSLLSLSWCKGSLPTTEGELSWPRSETGGLARLAVGEEVSAAPLEALSAALAMYRFQLFCPSWIDLHKTLSWNWCLRTAGMVRAPFSKMISSSAHVHVYEVQTVGISCVSRQFWKDTGRHRYWW